MRCPFCRLEGRKSFVTSGMVYSTLAYYPIRYDEDGKEMPKVENQTTTEYVCSNGHRFNSKNKQEKNDGGKADRV